MKNYRKSDYALNKFSEGIVYQFSDGTLEISMEDYLRDNPDKTEADFLELKALSDEIYLELVRLETAQGNKTVSMTGLEDTVAYPAPSLDEAHGVFQAAEGGLNAPASGVEGLESGEGEPVRVEIGDKGFRIAAVGLQTDNAKGYFVEIRAVRL